MIDDLPERAKNILSFLRIFIAEHGYAPTQRQIATACGIGSISSVNYWLRRLDEAGAIKIQPAISRAIVLMPAAEGA